MDFKSVLSVGLFSLAFLQGILSIYFQIQLKKTEPSLFHYSMEWDVLSRNFKNYLLTGENEKAKRYIRYLHVMKMTLFLNFLLFVLCSMVF